MSDEHWRAKTPRPKAGKMTHSWFQAMWQSIAILIISVIIGLGVNSLRHEGLPLVADGLSRVQRNSASGEDDLVISLEDAEVLYFDRRAVFLDARSKEQYRKGHIEGAINLPWEDFDRNVARVTAGIPQDAIIIVYCDGEGCSLSRELAMALLAKGYDRVHVLVDGWKLWQQYNLPTNVSP
jgi:rhodanese-related sulfurtransferase